MELNAASLQLQKNAEPLTAASDSHQQQFQFYRSSILMFSVEPRNVRWGCGINAATDAVKRWLFELARMGKIPVTTWF